MSWLLEEVGRARAHVEVPEVVGKQRARSSGRGRFYTPRKTRDFEGRVREAWLEQVGDEWGKFTGPVTVSVAVTRELARSNPRWWAGRQDTMRPDGDNDLKAVLDALNGVAYADDAQVTLGTVEKMPRTPHGSGSRVSIRCTYYNETFEEE